VREMKGLDWIKVSTDIGVDGDLEHLSDAAFRTYIELLAASSALLNDGRVCRRDARKRCNTRRLSVALDELSASGHVILDGDFIVLPKYGKWQLTRAEVEYARRVNSQRVALFREPGLQKAIRDRDGDFCRYCGQKVNWHDRRGPSGGTYDHVIPDGGNTLENVVVCCRSCNSSKGGRTPEEWGVELIPIQNVSNYRPSSRPSDDLLKSKSKSVNPPIVPPNGEDFTKFWNLYPRKQAKARAEKAWAKWAKAKIPSSVILDTLKAQLPELKKREREYIPLPATWLNGEPWRDEPEKSAEKQGEPCYGVPEIVVPPECWREDW